MININTLLSTSDTAMFVASLSDYDAGDRHGCWIELAGNTPEGVQKEIANMLKESKYPNAEEWAIQEYGTALLLRLGGHPTISDLIDFCDAWEEYGDAWKAYAECVGYHYATAEGFQTDYAGEARSEDAWVRDYIDSIGMLDEMPRELQAHFDYESYLNDLKAGGGISFERVGSTVFAFSAN